MCSVALYLAMGTLAKGKLHKSWHWVIYQKLTDSSKTETLPALSLPEGRAHPVHITYIA